MIYSVLESKMREAIDLDENKNKDGSINWNFVDADAYMDCKNLFRRLKGYCLQIQTMQTAVMVSQK